ncbi:radical SAM protein (plasmid) [Paraclostridium ghonii]|uniref:radical SAM/SPASM domain-containing protein n=1 Tax=Paraclostridium ghonii TaxID=29358 RepID=UPI00202CB648|nr:radical SAM protein [Paeniclostridium ghonii]MCM0165523.1 radical SAM protein [Paeniclostridium ghonii]
MCKNISLNSSVKQFNIEGINMIGNIQNGAIIGIDKKGLDFIEHINKKKFINEKELDLEQIGLLNALKEHSFLEENIYPFLNSAYVHVTDNCNLHCVGCYSFVDDRNCKDNLSLKDFCELFNSLKNSGVTKVVVSGGEPFLRNDLMEIFKYAKEQVKLERLIVITNGTMPIERYEKVIPYIDELSVSIDGYSETSRYIRDEGIMPKVIDTINTLKDKVKVHLIATLHKKNKDFMENYVEFAKELGVTLSFSIFSIDNSKKEFDDYILNNQDLIDISNNLINIDKTVQMMDFQQVQEISLICRERCEAGRSLISIDANGDIYPCHMLHEEDLKLGNILKDDIRTLLNSNLNEFKNLSVDNFEICSECEYKYLCGGGCRGRSYFCHNKINCRDPYCQFMKNFYKSTIDQIKTVICNE